MQEIFIDGTKVMDPINWDKAELSIKRDDSLGGILISENYSPEFGKDVYKRLLQEESESGYCANLHYRMDRLLQGGNFSRQVNEGKIFLSDCEFDIDKKRVKTKVTDLGFSSKIRNNFSVETKPFIGKSKSGNTIAPAQLYNVQLFKSSGIFYGINLSTGFGTCPAYKLYDVIAHYIAFMTDDEVSFRSDVLSTGEYKDIFVMSGMAVRSSSTTLTKSDYEQSFPNKSFEFYLKEVRKKLNLGFWIEFTQGRYVFRLEKRDFFYSNQSVINLDKVAEVRRSFKKSKLYSAVKFGSSRSYSDNLSTFPDQITFNGFKVEQFTIASDCNTDAVLDLSGEVVVSSNVIEHLVDTSTDSSFDSDIFFIHATFNSGSYKAVDSDWLFGGQAHLYNEIFTNASVAKRYFGEIGGDISQFAGTVDNSSLAINNTLQGFSNSVPVTIEPVPTTSVIYNLSGAYLGSDEYEAQTTDGHLFKSTLQFCYFNLYPANGTPIGSANIKVYLEVYDTGGFGGGSLISSNLILDETSNVPYNQIFTRQVSRTVFLNAGEKAHIKVVLDGYDNPTFSVGTTVRLMDGYRLEVFNQSTGGGYFEDYDPALYAVQSFALKTYLTDEQVELLERYPNMRVDFNTLDEYYSAWIESVNVNRLTNEASFNLITSQKLLQ